MIDTSLFPYENHLYRLEFGQKKNVTVCWFECDEHLQKYVVRSKLNPKEISIQYGGVELTKPVKKRRNEKIK
jgi:hypothetical protein